MKKTPRNYMEPDYEPDIRARAPEGHYLVAPHWPFKPILLGYVEREMADREHCLIRAVYDAGVWRAIEGSHRIWVAHKLGVVVTVQPVEEDYLVQHDNSELGIVSAADILGVGAKIRGPEARYRMRLVK